MITNDDILIWESFIKEDIDAPPIDPGQLQPPAIVQPADKPRDKNELHYFLRDFSIDWKDAFFKKPKTYNRLSEIFWRKLFGPNENGEPSWSLPKGWREGEIGDLLRELGWKDPDRIA